MVNPMVFVSFVLTGGADAGMPRNLVVDAPSPISSADAVSDLKQTIGERVWPGWSREDYAWLVTLLSWQRLESSNAD